MIKNLLVIILGISMITCSSDINDLSEDIPDPPVEIKLLKSIPRSLYDQSHFSVNHEIFKEDYFIVSIQDLNGPYNETLDYEPMPDVYKFDYDGNSIKYGFYEEFFKNKSQYDSINGMTYDVVDINNDGKEDFLLNFWGEGNRGSWYFPNFLVSAVSNGNGYDTTIVEDLTSDNSLGTYYSQTYFDFDGDGLVDIKAGSMNHHYFKNIGNNQFTKVIDDKMFISSGRFIKYDYDGDGDSDLLILQPTNTHIDLTTPGPQITIFENGTNINKKIVPLDWDIDLVAADDDLDYHISDLNKDGMGELIILTGGFDSHVNPDGGSIYRDGVIKVFSSENGNLVDKSDIYFPENTFKMLDGLSCKMRLYDYDGDGDDDIFFPVHIKRGDVYYYDYYYKNENGKFTKVNRTDL